MKHTVIALFDQQSDARKAAGALEAAGFDRTDVHVGANDEGATADEPVHLRPGIVIEGGTGVRHRLLDVLSNLFGVDEEPHAEHYDEAVRRGGTLVSVHADDEAQAARARDALLSCGAANIDDRVEEWRKGGWERASTRTAVSADGRSRTVVHRGEVSIGGVRVYGHAVAHRFEDYSDDFRSHHASRYAGQGGSYEDYDPAYRYGHALASDERYSGRGWDEIEAGARSDWERDHPEGAWERFKDAVRHAWERVTR